MSDKLPELTQNYLKDKGLSGEALERATQRVAELFASMEQAFKGEIAKNNDINFISSGAVKIRKKPISEPLSQKRKPKHSHL